MVEIAKTAVSRVECLAVHGRLPEGIAESSLGIILMENHIDACLVCKADAASGAVVSAAVRANVLPSQMPKAGFVDGVMSGLRSPSAPVSRHRPLVKVSAGAASAVAVAVVWSLRKRQRTLGAA
jgi:hypothetical protein